MVRSSAVDYLRSSLCRFDLKRTSIDRRLPTGRREFEMKVKEIMSHPVITVSEGASLEETAKVLLDNRIGGVPVIDDQSKLTGIVTESDFAAKEKGLPFSTFRAPQVLDQWLSGEGIEQIYKAARRRKAEEIMTCDVVVVSENDQVEEVVRLMLRHDINRIPVVSDGALVGIVARHDLLKLMLKN